ncbi:hypothetical protein PN499_27610 [Kamptonema animale CS-326]|jgi:hypothetical protein|uniref:hypothetical protein n=1 Tax=Kamptonema animale TaxID=92934 RepID=UPI00232F115A|nr:hypothetical protein [Kamptonema animale]MDB9514973.1 hypothetical protein [Kamptonema animale CS-326]
MRNLWVQILLISSAILTCGLIGLKSAIAQELNLELRAVDVQPRASDEEVKPGDWSYPALQEMVEHYGCYIPYPECYSRCPRNLARLQVAKLINACTERVNQIIAEGKSEWIRKLDVDNLEWLQEEFAAELATIPRSITAVDFGVNQVAIIVLNSRAIAQPVNSYIKASEMQQTVSALSIIFPNSEHYQTLKDLVDRYECLTEKDIIQEQRILSRTDFALVLDSCVTELNNLLRRQIIKKITFDIVNLERLQEEFAAELARIHGNVNSVGTH